MTLRVTTESDEDVLVFSRDGFDDELRISLPPTKAEILIKQVQQAMGEVRPNKNYNSITTLTSSANTDTHHYDEVFTLTNNRKTNTFSLVITTRDVVGVGYFSKRGTITTLEVDSDRATSFLRELLSSLIEVSER